MSSGSTWQWLRSCNLLERISCSLPQRYIFRHERDLDFGDLLRGNSRQLLPLTIRSSNNTLLTHFLLGNDRDVEVEVEEDLADTGVLEVVAREVDKDLRWVLRDHLAGVSSPEVRLKAVSKLSTMVHHFKF